MKSSEKVTSVSFGACACACPPSPAPPSKSQPRQRMVATILCRSTLYMSISFKSLSRQFPIDPCKIKAARALQELPRWPLASLASAAVGEIRCSMTTPVRFAEADRAAIKCALRLGAHIHEDRRCAQPRREHVRAHIVGLELVRHRFD